jgi:hypothetical protein
VPDSIKISAIAHVIQLSVAPVFLLTAIGAMLSVMTNRLSRVIDRARLIEAKLETCTPDRVREHHLHLAILSRRAKLVGRAITLCTGAAILICTVIVILFLGHYLRFDIAIPVSLLFIVAMVAMIFGLLLFIREIYIGTVSLRIGPR